MLVVRNGIVDDDDDDDGDDVMLPSWCCRYFGVVDVDTTSTGPGNIFRFNNTQTHTHIREHTHGWWTIAIAVDRRQFFRLACECVFVRESVCVCCVCVR